MKAKLVDYDYREYETDFGTCELCMYTGTAEEPRFKFEYDDGHTEWVDGYYWDWGDLFTVEIDNTANFAAWLAIQDLDGYIEDYSTLDQLSYKYELDMRAE